MNKRRQICTEQVVQDNDNKTTEAQAVDIFDILLDKNNRDPVVLVDEQGRKIAFEQVAIIPYDKEGNKVLYAILKPIDKISGIQDDEALVFFVDEDEHGNYFLKVETDEKLAIEVFGEYYKLLDEAYNRDDANKEISDFIKHLNKKCKGDKK